MELTDMESFSDGQ